MHDRRQPKGRPLEIWVLTILGFAVVLCTFTDYGITWDELPQNRYGELVLQYFTSGFSDTSCNDYLNLRFYGPPFELLAAFVHQFFPDAVFEVRHFLNACVGLLALLGLHRFALLFGSRRTAFFMVLALAMMPRFYGHMFNNPKDIPFACAMVWSLYAIARMWCLHKNTWRDVFFTGFCCGCALAIRSGGLSLLLIFALVCYAYELMTRERQGVELAHAMKYLAIFGIAWVIMVLPWPWAHRSPLLHPWRAIVEAAGFPEVYEVFFEAHLLASNELPRYYLIKYLLITIPPLTSLLAMIGIGGGAVTCLKKPRSHNARLIALAGVWLLVTIGLFVVRRPNAYDGMRQFLFVLPAVAIFAGLGAASFINRTPARFQTVATAALLVAMLSPAIMMAKIHPYQSSYFNSLAGGMANAAKHYDVDYWASSYKEASEWVNEDARRSGHAQPVVEIAANAYSYISAAYFLATNITYMTSFERHADPQLPAHVDYYIAMTRYNLDANYPEADTLYRVEREGAVLAVVKGRAKP